MKNLIEIKIEKEKVKKREVRYEFEKFLKKTNLYLDGDIRFDIVERRGFWSVDRTLAGMFIYEDYISVETDDKNLPRIKRLFEDFIKDFKIKVDINVKEKLGEDYY